MEDLFFSSELGSALYGEKWPTKLRQWAIYFSELVSETGFFIVIALILFGYLSWAYTRLNNEKRSLTLKNFFIFSTLSLFALLALRWPTFVWGELNPDESFLIASAMRLSKDPVFWRSVDGLTSGPLNISVLVPLLWINWSIDFATARLVGIFLLLFTIVANFCSFSSEFGQKSTALIFVVPLVILGGLSHPEFVHYGSEQVSLALIGVSFAMIIKLFGEVFAPSKIFLFFIGILIGLAPFAKLQSIPVAIYLGASALSIIFFRSERSQVLKRVSLLVAGSITPAVCLGANCLLYGVLEDAWTSYIAANLSYASYFKLSILERVVLIWSLIKSIDPIHIMFWTVLLSFVLYTVLIFFRRSSVRAREWWMLLFSLGLVVAGLFAAMSPGRNFFHYLWFIIIPLLLSLSLVCCIATRIYCGTRGLRISGFLILLTFLISLSNGLYFGRRPFLEPEIIPRYLDSFVGRLIISLRNPGDTLSVWGWCSAIYPQVGLPPATRDGHTERQVTSPISIESYYRTRYLKDLSNSKATFFLDSVGYGPCSFGFKNRDKFAHENFSELGTYISENYQFVADQQQLRLYVRLEKLAAVTHPANLYPLLVYLELSRLGGVAYSAFDKAYSSTLNIRWRLKSKKIPANVNDLFMLQQRITERTLDLLESTGGAKQSDVQDIREKTSRRAQNIFNLIDLNGNEPSVETIIANPIRQYRDFTDPMVHASLP